MTTEKMIKLAKNHLKTALLIGLLLGAVSFLVLVMTQKSFVAETDILIIQNQEGPVDYLGSIITKSIYSEKFLGEVISSGKISSGFLSGDKADRIKQWKKIISVKKNSNVGIVNLRIYGDTQKQASEISEGVLEVLINKNSMFLGKGQNLEICVLSGPIVEKNPSFLEIILASIGGFLVGMILVFMFAIYRNPFINIKERKEIELYPIEKANEEILSNNEYLSANSDYWKERLNGKQ